MIPSFPSGKTADGWLKTSRRFFAPFKSDAPQKRIPSSLGYNGGFTHDH
jgi:hypothetical protein